MWNTKFHLSGLARFTVLFIAIDGPVSFKNFPSICYTCQIFWNAMSQLKKGYSVQCKDLNKKLLIVLTIYQLYKFNLYSCGKWSFTFHSYCQELVFRGQLQSTFRSPNHHYNGDPFLLIFTAYFSTLLDITCYIFKCIDLFNTCCTQACIWRWNYKRFKTHRSRNPFNGKQVNMLYWVNISKCDI